MEYPFKDLLPLDEVLEREGYYKDWTHLNPEVFYSLTQISKYIKTKGYGVDVRLLIAQLAEHFGLKTTQVIDLANLLQQKFDKLEGVTQSFTDNINSLVAQMEADKNAVIANATVDSEVILSRNGHVTLGERLKHDFTQVSKTTSSQYVTIDEFGAVGDYNLPDGSINPNPTDNTPFVQAAIDAGHNHLISGKGNYYFASHINAPKDFKLDLNGSFWFFEHDGINLGNHVWNRPEIKNGELRGIGRKGRGLFATNAYIVYPVFDLRMIEWDWAVDIVSIDNGVEDFKSNGSWGSIDLFIELSNNGIRFEGGWVNTLKFRRLILNNITRQAFHMYKVNQFHRMTFDKLVIELTATEKDYMTSPFLVEDCSNGSFTINDLYIEANGYKRVATTDEALMFTSNGTKVPSVLNPVYDTKAWQLDGERYQEDSRYIVPANIGYHSHFEFRGCGHGIKLNIYDVFFSSEMLGIASATNSQVVAINLRDFHLNTAGVAFPLSRHLFMFSGNAPKVKTRNLTNTGGGGAFSYGGVPINGDKFGELEKEGSLSYQIVRRANNLSLPPGKTKVALNETKSGKLGVLFGTVDPSNIVIPSDGVYEFSATFALSGATSSPVLVDIKSSAINKITKKIPSVVSGDSHTISGMLELKKDDIVNFEVNNTSQTTLDFVGYTNNVNFMIIKKIV